MERFARFMQGRYGIDKLFYGICGTAIVISFINIFTRSTVMQILTYLLLIWAFFRVLSKKVSKRAEENRKFCKIWDKFTGNFRLLKRMWTDRKTHSYVKCSNCKKILRLPKKKGVHTVKCPNCGDSFRVKI
jgi:predicted RNA-binding Zn-ribbon protein involved in translation (DUF1610 family)